MTKHIAINFIVFQNNKHHYRNFNKSLKILIDTCTDLNVDSGSCSNLKYSLRLLLELKIMTPALART